MQKHSRRVMEEESVGCNVDFYLDMLHVGFSKMSTGYTYRQIHTAKA